jgi:hypothetical protein
MWKWNMSKPANTADGTGTITPDVTERQGNNPGKANYVLQSQCTGHSQPGNYMNAG